MKKVRKIKREFIYWSKWTKFLCYSCANNHSDGIKHNILNIKRYDSVCKTHSNSYCSYCINFKKYLFIFCKKVHIEHKLINDLLDFDFHKTKNKLEEEMNNLEINCQK